MSEGGQQPVAIAQAAVGDAKRQFFDVLIVDTAGRLHVDAAMMEEIQVLHAAVTPVETLFVVDAMTGQDAANTAKAFHDALLLTGVVLTRLTVTRGGAVASIRYLTGKPTVPRCRRETAALEPFHPDRVAPAHPRQGATLSLVEEVERNRQGKGAEARREGQVRQDLIRGLPRADGNYDAGDGGMAGLLDKLLA